MRFRLGATGFVGRARILSAIFILAAVLLAARLYFVQVIHGEQYRKSALGQYVADVRDTEDRGTIFFKEKDGDLVAAALMQGGWRLAIAPKEITDAEAVFEKLSSANVDRERFFASVAKTDDPYEEVGFRIPDEVAEAIRAQKIPGVLLVQDQWRYYPAALLAAHAVGFVGYQGDRRLGVYGLERWYEKTLVKSGSGLYVNPFAEIFTNIGAAISDDPAEGYGSIITSIEPQVQSRLEETLNGVMDTYSPRSAAGIVMDPRTGEIVAIAARPAFDPNTYNTADISVFGNLLVENVYEMGSIMKPLSVATGIDVGVITPETTYEDRGCIEKSGKKICNYDGKARGVVDMQQVLNQSLNLGASFIEGRIGHNVFGEYIHAFGLGEKTGIDLPNEATGLVRSIDRGYDVDYASASFGQGIAQTGVEMIRALAALANEGVLPSPHLVTDIRLESGIVRSVTPAKGPRVLKPETVQTVSSMLVKVFDTALLGGVLKQEHYSIAAKTGTAQIALPRGGGYYEDRFLHSFFGYFPAHDPKFIVFLVAVEPHGAQFASATLARPFLNIAKYLINYYDIPPDR
ncbi:penicillin-binding protein 2 [Candidatus Kaiserbacteria bacterium]|nr:penicillin-binding protein 2 [Candidatus Kaiserbacteria bacterium]